VAADERTGMADDGVHRRVRPDFLPALVRYERALWTVALAALALDCLLTAYGLSIGLEERNPVAAAAIARLGPAASFAVLKGAALAVALAGRRLLPLRHAPIAPLSLAVPWVVGVAVNAAVIAAA
jgi:hypothetical protein